MTDLTEAMERAKEAERQEEETRQALTEAQEQVQIKEAALVVSWVGCDCPWLVALSFKGPAGDNQLCKEIVELCWEDRSPRWGLYG